MAKIIIITGLLSLGLHLNAQNLNGHFLPFGLGYGYETVKDDALSPVSYSGSLGRISIGYYYQNDKWNSMLDIAGLAGYQYPDVNRENKYRNTLTILGRGTYRVSRKVYEYRSWIFHAGLLSHNLWDFRSHSSYSNSSTNYIGSFSLGPSLSVEKPFVLFNKNFALQYYFGLPVATYYLRPGYVKPFQNQKIENRDFAFLGDFYILDSRTDLIWILSNSNQLRLGYQWGFSQLDILNKVQTATHQISISTVFKF